MRKNSPKYGRIDKNQNELVDYLRGLGASVALTSNVHKGFPDIVVGFEGINYLCEIKSGKNKLTEDQVKFFEEWKGQANVIRSKEDIDSLLLNGYI